MNRECSSAWVVGSELDINEDCNVIRGSNCPAQFISYAAKFGQWTNSTVTLESGASCLISINAQYFVGRVLFDQSRYLGIDGYEGKFGESISFKYGSNNTILIYNAA